MRIVEPQEGCALLLGRPLAERGLLLDCVWPVCNRWGAADVEQPWQGAGGRERNFLVDPREQLAAQRWGRDNQRSLLGVAHSHPAGEARPSQADLRRSEPQRLMLILDGVGDVQAWWLGEDRRARPLPIHVL